MKKLQMGAGISLLAAVAMVAACQAGPPSVPQNDENRISRGANGTGSATTPGAKPGQQPGAQQPGGQQQAGGDGLTVSGDLAHGTVDRDALMKPGEFTPGPAKLSGYVKDEAGQPVPGATVTAGGMKATTDANGYWALDVQSSPLMNVKVLKSGFILRDASFPVQTNQNLLVDVSVVKASDNQSRISAAAGGKAVSADGQAELIIPPNALKADADVRVTWLNPVDSAAPSAFTLKQAEDAEAGPVPETKIRELNSTQLPGPLETTAYGDRKFFSPVSFADVSMTENLKDGESATLRMKVSKQVYDDMTAAGDLKDSDLGQEIFPCFSWNADGSTWDKPALSKVEKDDQGYWFVYTVRANNMSTPAGYRQLQIGDQNGQARVELVVGGGRRVVDGTFTYSALIERSSDPEFDLKGAQYLNGKTTGVKLVGGADWSGTGGHYRATNRSNLARPTVTTQNYTGTTYAQIMGTDKFDKWDRNGMFQLAYAPGDKFEINPPNVYGVKPTPEKQNGTTSTAAKPYLPAELSFSITRNIVQQQSIPATYVLPFYYHTDATLSLTLTGELPDSGDAVISYTLDGGASQAKTTSFTKGQSLTFKFPRNAAAKPRNWELEKLTIGDYTSDPKSNLSASLPVGGSVSASLKMILVAPK